MDKENFPLAYGEGNPRTEFCFLIPAYYSKIDMGILKLAGLFRVAISLLYKRVISIAQIYFWDSRADTERVFP